MIKIIDPSDIKTIEQMRRWEEQEWGTEGVTSTDAPFALAGAFDGEKLIGMSVLARRDLEPRPSLTPWIASVYTLPDYRRGISKKLMAALEKKALELDFKTLWLYTEDVNLYSNQGWIYVESLKLNDVDIHIMYKEI